MIELNPRLFTRAAQKAANVQPAVEKHGARYFVSRADGGRAVVRFVPRAGALWCECDCPAGTPQSRQQPVPCYHVAAVLLFENAAKPTTHKHGCPVCHELWTCAGGCISVPDRVCDWCANNADGQPDYGDHRYWN